jgi:membrane protease YdiL (CAAX protease family)
MTWSSLRPPAAARAFWWSCALAAPPIAFAVAASGYPMAVREPARDLALIVLWSVAEEIVFRGALQPALARAFARRFDGEGRATWLTRANLVTSAVFAAFHLWRHPWPVALGVFPVSLVYGKARELSGRWWPAAALHVAFNVLLYGASWWLLAGGR